MRREKARPFTPLVVLTGFQSPGGMLIQGGIFGFGANGNLNQWSGRDDVSIQLMWQIENFGIGNLARSRPAARIAFGHDHQAPSDAGRRRGASKPGPCAFTVGDRPGGSGQPSLRTGIITFNGAVEGLEHTTRFGDVLVLITRPQEAVYALQLLNARSMSITRP